MDRSIKIVRHLTIGLRALPDDVEVEVKKTSSSNHIVSANKKKALKITTFVGGSGKLSADFGFPPGEGVET
jgi:hypothetical protein